VTYSQYLHDMQM